MLVATAAVIYWQLQADVWMSVPRAPFVPSLWVRAENSCALEGTFHLPEACGMSESACVLNEKVSIFALQVGWVFTPCHLHLRILGGKHAWSSQFTFSSSSKVFLKREGNRKQREMSGLVRVVLLCFPVFHTRFLHMSLFVVFTPLSLFLPPSPNLPTESITSWLPVCCMCSYEVR